MEPDRFDDVAYRILEDPSAPEQAERPPRRRRRAVIAFGVAAASAGVLAAGASALGGGEAASTRGSGGAPVGGDGWTSYAPLKHHGFECHADGSARKRGETSAAVPRD
jgi:hypothetical protein